MTTRELLKVAYSLERVLSGEPDDNQLDVWWAELRSGTLVGDDDSSWEEIANATLFGMDPYRGSLVGEAPFDVADAYSADTLAEAVFVGAPTPKAAVTLRTHVMRLRKVLEEDGTDPVLETQAPGYAPWVADDAVDAVRFERLVAEGRACRSHWLIGTRCGSRSGQS